MAKRFIQYFEDSFKENWELPAVTNYVTKQTYAYKDVAREIAKLHILFRELNIQKNDKIALVGNNTPEWAIAFLATVTYGAVVVPILQEFHPDDIAHIIEHSESKLLFIGDSYWNRLEEKDTHTLRAVFALDDFRCIRQAEGETLHITMRLLPSLFRERYPQGVQREDVQYPDKDDQEMCVLSYTSGTTGFSKGVMLKGEGFSFILNFCFNSNQGGKGQKILSTLPLSHTFGMVYDLCLPMVIGVHIVFLVMPPSPRILINAMSQIKPDWISIVPLLVETVCKKHIFPLVEAGEPIDIIRSKFINLFGGSFKQMAIGGAALDWKIEELLAQLKIPFTVGYGMTECSPTICAEFRNFIPGSVGKPMPGIFVKIDSDNPYDICGEILVKGPNVMKGYYKDEVNTRLSFTSDGWLRTGDVGLMDKEGNVYLKGRKKSMILSSTGQNIYPEELESKININPLILESVVYQHNNKIIALVYPDFSKVKNDDQLLLVMEEQRNIINEYLSEYQYISEFKISYDPFVKTPKNTIRRHLYV